MPQESERVRVPPPLLKRRIPSGRGATEQPNATSDGDAALTPRFWLAVVLTGIATGLFGAGLMWLLFSVEHLAFGYHVGSFDAGVLRASALRRVLVLVLSGVIGGIGWWVIRRHLADERAEIDEAIWDGDGSLGFRRSFATSIVSEIVIGMGASIGREAAPKLMGGVSGSMLATWTRLTPAQRRLLVACGGGAGLACVYNVPLGGAMFTAEILIGSVTLPTMLPALACAWIATATAWLYLPDHATYLGLATFRMSGSLLCWSVLVGPVIGLVGAAYIRLIAWVSHHRVVGTRLLVTFPAALAVLGALGVVYPQLFGNGKDLAHNAFLGEYGLALLAVLLVLKPLVTAMCLRAGGSGGLFTPTLSTGALLGALLGGLWSLAWPGDPRGAFALVGATAMIGSSMQAPMTGLVLALELVRGNFTLAVPMVAAVVGATIVARHLDGYSIYSARLPARSERT